jgi:predicted XRE-type DNA-binding protein
MLDDPVPELRRQLARAVMDSVDGQNYFVAAAVLDLATTRFSKLRHGRVEYFSIEKLVRLLAYVDRRVDLSVVDVGLAEPRIWKIIAHHDARRRQKRLL